MFYIGCPMWGYKDWVGSFFPAHTPQSDFLRLYSRQMNSVEGNTTFYATPSGETIQRWRQETPDTFRFCPKISRDISHRMPLPTPQTTAIELLPFVERMRKLGERLGPMFLQLPPGFAPEHIGQLETMLPAWPRDVRLAVEVRHPDFFKEPHAEKLNALLQQYAVARVMMDTRPIRVGTQEEQRMLQARERKPHLPLQLAVTTDFTFVRYIGHPTMEVNTPFLAQWARQIADWLAQKITVYAFCHCPFEVHSPDIARALYTQVAALTPIPSLQSGHTQGESPEQATLF